MFSLKTQQDGIDFLNLLTYCEVYQLLNVTKLLNSEENTGWIKTERSAVLPMTISEAKWSSSSGRSSTTHTFLSTIL